MLPHSYFLSYALLIIFFPKHSCTHYNSVTQWIKSKEDLINTLVLFHKLKLRWANQGFLALLLFSRDGVFIIYGLNGLSMKSWLTKNKMGVLKTQICSRHTSRTHNLWVKHNTGPNPVIGWFCTWKWGTRVVGCFAHITSALWCWGFEWHQPATKTSKTEGKKKDSLTSAVAEVWDTNSYSSDESHTGGDLVKNY